MWKIHTHRDEATRNKSVAKNVCIYLCCYNDFFLAKVKNCITEVSVRIFIVNIFEET